MDTLSQTDKKLINIVHNIVVQQDSTIKNLDTLIVFQKLMLVDKNKQIIVLKEINKIKDKQLGQTTNQIINLSKENKKLKVYKQIVFVVIPIVIIETLIIIFK
jgi:hypothetical protein